MAPIPTINTAQTAIDLLKPAIFFVVNLFAIYFLFPILDKETKKHVFAWIATPVLNFILIFGFVFLGGIFFRAL